MYVNYIMEDKLKELKKQCQELYKKEHVLRMERKKYMKEIKEIKEKGKIYISEFEIYWPEKKSI